jgi:hypothetical protein
MNGVTYAVRAEEFSVRDLGQPSQLIVGSQFCMGLEYGSRGIVIVNIHYQETSNEDTA